MLRSEARDMQQAIDKSHPKQFRDLDGQRLEFRDKNGKTD